MAYSKSVAIAADLRAQILNSEFEKGAKLPTENELSDRYGVSRQTVRKALQDLSKDNLITSVQGSGSYVAYEAPSRKTTMHITVITSYISEYIFPSILRGIENCVSASGYTLNIRATNNSIATERRILEDILENPVDGLIVEGTKTTMPNPNVLLYSKIADLGIPIVMCNNYYPALEIPGYPHVIARHNGMHPNQSHTNVCHVVLDDYAGGYALTDMLIKAGHNTIGGVFKSDDMQGFIRYSGYLDCMLYHRADFQDRNIVWYTTESLPIISNYLVESNGNFRLFHSLLTECTALIVYNDQVAKVVLSVLDQVPESRVRCIYSFDRHLPLHSETGIETYSVGYPEDSIGSLIGQKLLDLINGKPAESEMLAWAK